MGRDNCEKKRHYLVKIENLKNIKIDNSKIKSRRIVKKGNK